MEDAVVSIRLGLAAKGALQRTAAAEGTTPSAIARWVLTEWSLRAPLRGPSGAPVPDAAPGHAEP